MFHAKKKGKSHAQQNPKAKRMFDATPRKRPLNKMYPRKDIHSWPSYTLLDKRTCHHGTHVPCVGRQTCLVRCRCIATLPWAIVAVRVSICRSSVDPMGLRNNTRWWRVVHVAIAAAPTEYWRSGRALHGTSRIDRFIRVTPHMLRGCWLLHVGLANGVGRTLETLGERVGTCGDTGIPLPECLPPSLDELSSSEIAFVRCQSGRTGSWLCNGWRVLGGRWRRPAGLVCTQGTR